MDEDDRPRPVLSLLFWLSLLLAFACIAAGAVVGVYGPTLFPPHRASPPALGKPTARLAPVVSGRFSSAGRAHHS